MGINTTALAQKLAGVTVTMTQAVTIVSTAIDLIQLAEQLYEGMSGADKLAAVQAGLETVVEQMGVKAEFDALWAKLAPLISMIVKVFNLKNLWAPKAVAPVSTPAPAVNLSSGQTLTLGGVATPA